MSERRRRMCAVWIAAIAAVAVLAVGCSSSGTSHGNGSGARIKGGTVTYGNYAPPPTWIWPYEPLTNYDDVQDFLWLLYRPLYMYGDNGSSLNVNYPLSTANAPVYTDGDKTVTINLKGWKWSDGETVDASDIMFWLNMMKAEPEDYAGYVPGLLPDNLVSFKATGPLQVTLQLNKPYSSLWFTYNQLAEITPMPAAWDVTSMGAKQGSGGCATDTAADKYAKCKAVYAFLAGQAKNTATYVSSPIWSVVDGPWRLSSFSSDGDDTFVPNSRYSGSPKPTISVFQGSHLHLLRHRVRRAEDRAAGHRLHPARGPAAEAGRLGRPVRGPAGQRLHPGAFLRGRHHLRAAQLQQPVAGVGVPPAVCPPGPAGDR